MQDLRNKTQHKKIHIAHKNITHIYIIYDGIKSVSYFRILVFLAYFATESRQARRYSTFQAHEKDQRQHNKKKQVRAIT